MSANAACFFVDRHLEQGRSDKIAFLEVDGRELSFRELSEGSAQVAGALLRAGIRREERALMLVLDCVEFPQIFWGALKAGVVPVPVNTLLSTSVYAEILKDSRASCLFVSAPLYGVIEPLLSDAPSLRHVIAIGGDTPPGASSYENFCY